jgi:hypothetical protein
MALCNGFSILVVVGNSLPVALGNNVGIRLALGNDLGLLVTLGNNLGLLVALGNDLGLLAATTLASQRLSATSLDSFASSNGARWKRPIFLLLLLNSSRVETASTNLQVRICC